jgi:hypothetical protein
MTTSTHPSGPARASEAFATPATAEQIVRTASAQAAKGFILEILDDVAAAGARISGLVAPRTLPRSVA